MKKLFFLLLAVIVLGVVDSASAQILPPVPPELRGMYNGKFTEVSYSTDPPMKRQGELFVTINESSCQFYSVSDGIPSSPINGISGRIGSFVFFSGNVGGGTVGGRFQVKGKPGKLKGKGALYWQAGGFLGLVEGKLSLKQLPIL